jgi:O-acetyl-ADP-ribose deacetylase (regulator of RNase III)
LQFPRTEVAKIFFEEVTSYLTVHPQSTINDIRFVAYGGDQATVDAFLGLLSKTNKYIQ